MHTFAAFILLNTNFCCFTFKHFHLLNTTTVMNGSHLRPRQTNKQTNNTNVGSYPTPKQLLNSAKMTESSLSFLSTFILAGCPARIEFLSGILPKLRNISYKRQPGVICCFFSNRVLRDGFSSDIKNIK